MMKRNFVTAQMKKLLVLCLALMMMVSGTLFVYAAEYPDDNDSYIYDMDIVYGARVNYYDLYMNKDGTWLNVVMEWSGGAGGQSCGMAADSMTLETWMLFNGNDEPQFSGSVIPQRVSNGTATSAGITTLECGQSSEDEHMILLKYDGSISILHAQFDYMIIGKDIVTKQEFGSYLRATVNGFTYQIQSTTDGDDLPTHSDIPKNGDYACEYDEAKGKIVYYPIEWVE